MNLAARNGSMPKYLQESVVLGNGLSCVLEAIQQLSTCEPDSRCLLCTAKACSTSRGGSGDVSMSSQRFRTRERSSGFVEGKKTCHKWPNCQGSE